MAKKSVEEAVEDHFKRQLDACGVRYYIKTESINDAIDEALRRAPSKSGGAAIIFLTYAA